MTSAIPEAGRPERLWERAQRYLAQNNAEAARITLESLVGLQPDHFPARLRLSTLATAQGRYRDSVAQLLGIAERRPDDPELLSILAAMLHRLGESRAALDCVSHRAFDAVTDRARLQEMAQLASQLEAVERAGVLLDRAESFGGADSASLYARATLQLFTGQLQEAEATLESCLALAPGHAQAHWALSRVRRQTEDRNHVQRLEWQLGQARDPISVVYLAFALFKELDDLGRSEQAWTALARGCAAKRGLLGARPEDEAAAFAQLQRMQAPPARVPSPSLPPGPTPVFIVGMPRTGTTLLEGILGRHPDVHNAGELDDMPLQLRWLANRFSKSYLDADVFRLAQGQDMAALGRRYLEHAAWRAQGRPLFTDKLPLNFLHVGFIAAALPQARIVHMVRNPMDTCFSNLKELFTEVYPYSYDQGELAAHYGRYRRLMAHWHQQLPGRILDLSYEGLVSDPIASARRLLEFCGLPWNDACADAAADRGTVTTASSVQVREPIHRQGIDGWRRYEPQLEPLRQALLTDGWLPT